jgi:hypothetical protein
MRWMVYRFISSRGISMDLMVLIEAYEKKSSEKNSSLL